MITNSPEIWVIASVLDRDDRILRIPFVPCEHRQVGRNLYGSAPGGKAAFFSF